LRKVHVITVGLSILDSLEEVSANLRNGAPRWSRRGAANALIVRTNDAPVPELVGRARDGEALGSDALRRISEGSGSATARRLGAFMDELHRGGDEGDWALCRISAELDGFVRQTRDDLEPHGLDGAALHDDDSVVFVMSNTEIGKYAGFWNIGLHTGGDFDRVHIVSLANLPASGGIQSGHVYGLVLDDLTESSIPEFVRELGRFGRLFSLALSGDEVEVVMHLSGGLKAALPYFLALGEWLRYRHAGGAVLRVSAWARHELSNKSVPLPIRFIHVSDSERDFLIALKRAVNAARKKEVDSKTLREALDSSEMKDGFMPLEGYAYTISLGGRRGEATYSITDIGSGLAEYCDG